MKRAVIWNGKVKMWRQKAILPIECTQREKCHPCEEFVNGLCERDSGCSSMAAIEVSLEALNGKTIRVIFEIDD